MLARGALGDERAQAREERAGRVAGARHLVLGRVLGPVGIAEQARDLVALLEQPRQHCEVLRHRAVVDGEVVLAPQVRALAPRHERGAHVWVGREHDRAVGARRMRGDDVGRQTGERARAFGQHDLASAGDDVALELLADRDELLLQRPQSRARRIVAIDAAAAEVAQRAREQVPRRVGRQCGRVDRGEARPQAAVE